MSHPESTHEVAVKTETKTTTEQTTSSGDTKPVTTKTSEHRVEDEGKATQVQPDGR